MINLQILEEVAADQLKIFRGKDIGFKRDLDMVKYSKTKQIVVVSGVRRSGKSTLLAQFSENFKEYYYINFDDERLAAFQLEDFAE